MPIRDDREHTNKEQIHCLRFKVEANLAKCRQDGSFNITYSPLTEWRFGLMVTASITSTSLALHRSLFSTKMHDNTPSECVTRHEGQLSLLPPVEWEISTS